MSLIDVTHVQKGFKPTIPNEDSRYVLELIEEAELELELPLGDLPTWIGTDEKRKRRLQIVLARMVRRVLKNPEGFVSESDGDYSYIRARELVGTGSVRVIPDDLRFLGRRRQSRARSIRVGLPVNSPRNMPRPR